MKSYFKIFSLTFLTILLFFNGCKKDNKNSGNVDVYISGSINGKATYWKNGVASTLGDGNSLPGKIIVSGGDVYVSGGEVSSQAVNAFYFKNGTRINLGVGDSTGVTSAIAVNGSDIYLAGSLFTSTYDEADYWKNNTLTDLGPGDAYAIATSGSDVYVAGRSYNDPINGPHATYWKNAVPIDLGIGSANGIAVQGNDVYVAGYLNTGPSTSLGGYWKNNVFVQIEDSANADIYDIKLSGSDIYLAGYIDVKGNNSAAIWKNGVITIYKEFTNAYGLALSGNNTYVVGGNSISGVATPGYLWVNNAISPLSGTVNSIFVVTN